MRDTELSGSLDSQNKSVAGKLGVRLRNNPSSFMFVVGAGVSVGNGYPTWEALIQKLRGEAIIHKEDLPNIDTFSEFKDPLWQAEFYRQKIPKSNYHAFLRNEFGEKKSKVNDLVLALMQFPVRLFLTLNYDDLLERGYEAVHKKPAEAFDWTDGTKVVRLLSSLDAKTTSVCHLHGSAGHPENIVLTERDYARQYLASDHARKRLFLLFATKQIVFVGFSLRDPDFLWVLRETLAVLDNSTTKKPEKADPRHYAIVPWAKGKKEQEALLLYDLFLSKYGTKPIFYPTDREGRDHQNLLKLVTALRDVDPQVSLDIPLISQGKAACRPPSSATLASKDKATGVRAPIRDPEDPQSGRWGGKSRQNGRVLGADVEELGDGWYALTLWVKRIKGPPLKGSVTFHLHDTFDPDQRTVRALKGTATLELESYGAFTVGAEADGGKTVLELNLAKAKKLPKGFRES